MKKNISNKSPNFFKQRHNTTGKKRMGSRNTKMKTRKKRIKLSTYRLLLSLKLSFIDQISDEKWIEGTKKHTIGNALIQQCIQNRNQPTNVTLLQKLGLEERESKKERSRYEKPEQNGLASDNWAHPNSYMGPTAPIAKNIFHFFILLFDLG